VCSSSSRSSSSSKRSNVTPAAAFAITRHPSAAVAAIYTRPPRAVGSVVATGCSCTVRCLGVHVQVHTTKHADVSFGSHVILPKPGRSSTSHEFGSH
jgi:hypothetical protein